MASHLPEKARFNVCKENGDVVVSCQYWQVRHGSSCGGNIAGILFPHGSGRNIFAAPVSTQVGLFAKGTFPTFENAADSSPRLTHGAAGEIVYVESESALAGPKGDHLPAKVRHRFEYHPWGYIRQRVSVQCLKPIPDVWQVQIARPVVARHLDEFTYRRSPIEAESWSMSCGIPRWFQLHGGEDFNDQGAAMAGNLPLHFIFLQRGVEGFDWFMAANIDQWRRQMLDIPHVNQFRVGYRADLDGYEVRICPADYWHATTTLKGTYAFDFFMGLPFVRDRVRPLVRCIGGLLEQRAGRAHPEFPATATIEQFGRHKVELTRLHNDGPAPDGIFWRDCAYPPYPSKRMRAMDRCIHRLHRNDVKVVPYFSLHEWHPDAAPFLKMAPKWRRAIDRKSTMLHNKTPVGEFGAQMCLRSDWLPFRKKTIDVVLKNHAFDGVYYDWTFALPCVHSGHAPYLHWDVEEFIDLLEWTRERVGPAGVMYLHMSGMPFIVAENMATSILTLEEFAPHKVHPDMFPPNAQFMKTCPHGVLVAGQSVREPKRFTLCALLNNVSPDSRDPQVLAAFKTLAGIDFTRYRHFENHHTKAIQVSSPDVRVAMYWNEDEALVLLANLAPQPRAFTWKLLPEHLGWKSQGYRVTGASPRRLPALGFRYVNLRRGKA